MIFIKVLFFTIDLEAWEKVPQNYLSNPVNIDKYLQYIIKQHNSDWNNMQLLLDSLTEIKKQLIMKMGGDLAED